ncbi:MAG: diaminopimelate epimerase [Fusobacteriaceae bacterium]|nr:diaminopimelate epimerase [Fusobacteriaceae bacterium]MBP9510070.1 diaminopimelate epimerase [Fusobacteriaceae bacterium]
MLSFEKYHGLGNDFIIFKEVDLLKKFKHIQSGWDLDREYSKLAQGVCHRNTGIGADGMIVLKLLSPDMVEMMFYNQDGSRVPMCGNGIRCFSHFIYENKILEGNIYKIKTLAGVLTVEISIEDGFKAKVNMGYPLFQLESIPMDKENFLQLLKTDSDCKNMDIDEGINYKLKLDSKEYTLSSVFMGTTHTVIFVDELNDEEIKEDGKRIENNSIFPKKTNVNFVKIRDRENIEMKTWERGAGLTLACGTGACSAVVIGNMKLNKLDKKVKVHLPIGELFIELNESVYMTGPSELISKGVYYEKI